MSILFLYLTAFSRTGGIEKFNRAFLKALQEISLDEHYDLSTLSLYDNEPDRRYISEDLYWGFNGKKTRFVVESILRGLNTDLIVLGHINLAPIGLIIKQLKKNVSVVLVTHGIEVWNNLSRVKKKMLKSADLILSVSGFTKKRLQEVHNMNPERISILHNTIDPYFTAPSSFEKPQYLLEKLGISEKTKVILSVSRLSSLEKYKGYDKVIKVLPDIKKEVPDVRYILVGKGDIKEINRIEKLIDELELGDNVTLTGYVGDDELQDYYMISDVFVLPSKGEGFGIVLIEALACGSHVIAGNKDASSETLLDGELGTLVDPDNLSDIKSSIIRSFKNELNAANFYKMRLHGRVSEEYGFTRFKERVSMTLKTISAH